MPRNERSTMWYILLPKGFVWFPEHGIVRHDDLWDAGLGSDGAWVDIAHATHRVRRFTAADARRFLARAPSGSKLVRVEYARNQKRGVFKRRLRMVGGLDR